MKLIERFQEYIKEQQLFHKNDGLLIAVSGGVDSIVLCELCKVSGYNFSIAHCNFQLRGEESKRDEEFVVALAKNYAVPFFTTRFETEQFASDNKLSIQVAARQLRYRWFDQLTANNNPEKLAYVLTAHHVDDAIETSVMNFFKGTGIAGLRSIVPKNRKIIRPLLFAGKEEIILFAKEYNLSWADDSSNVSDKYTRNYFRHNVLPAIELAYPEAKSNLAANLPRFRDIESLYQQAITLHRKKLVQEKNNELYIPVLKLLKSVPTSTILFELIKEFGFTPSQVEDVLKLCNSQSGKYVLSPTHRILRNRNWLIISRNEPMLTSNIIIETVGEQIFPAGKLLIQGQAAVPQDLSTPVNSTYVDKNEIIYPIILRQWKAGDYFYPLGMRKKKKLARFFIDSKLSRTDKEQVWVIEQDKKIIWVLGHRLDDRFKVTAATKEVLKLDFIRK